MKGVVLIVFSLALAVPIDPELADYLDRTITQLAGQSPFPQVILVSIALVALLLMLTLREKRTEYPVRYIVYRYQEVRGPAGEDVAVRIPERRQFSPVAALRRLGRVLRHVIAKSR